MSKIKVTLRRVSVRRASVKCANKYAMRRDKSGRRRASVPREEQDVHMLSAKGIPCITRIAKQLNSAAAGVCCAMHSVF